MQRPKSAAELRRLQSDERRQQLAASIVATAHDQATAPLPRLSFAAEILGKALPRPLIEDGAIRFDPQGQPRVALYEPRLLAPNPQRGRVVDRGLDELATSLDAHGQQEPIVCRLITQTDRDRWPEAFSQEQILLILKGHRLYFAQPGTKMRLLRVELLLPEEGENDLAYSRRALRRAAIKLMHSQGYDIFDKVNQYAIWRDEFALAKPKDADIAAYFDISRSEAQRLKVVSQLENSVAQEIINSDRRPADEVVFYIASRPVEEHREAFKKFGHLTVAAARRLLKQEDSAPEGKLTGPGRPRNYVLAIRDDDLSITYISTGLTAQEWRRRGGSKAFWKAITELVNRRAVQERLERDLDESPTSGTP